MQKVIEVIYEDGVFKPLKKIEIPEKTKMKIRIEDIDDLIEKFCGLLDSKITPEEIKKLRYEVKTWKR